MIERVGGAGAWQWLLAGEWRAVPLRFLLAALAIAVGVSLGFAVHIVNRSAADAFGEAVRSVAGDADLQVRATSGLGFDERLYPRLFAVRGVADASPVIHLSASAGPRDSRFALLGLDMLRALTVSPNLLGRRRIGRNGVGSGGRPAMADAAFDMDALYLSEAAQHGTGLAPGDAALVRVGRFAHLFTVVGDMPGVAAGQPVGMIDIAAAQWRFGRLGKLDRIDLKLADGASRDVARAALAETLPAGALVTDPANEGRRGDSLSRAYRVNLDMLALVALLTGGFLVYSAQSLSVTRRLRQFALLRTLGLQEQALRGQLLAEGAVLGVAGSLAGLALGYGLAALAMRFVGGDLGGGYFGGTSPELHFAPAAALLFLGFGIAAAIGGSYAPARQAARIAPAEALKNAGDMVDPRSRPPWAMALTLLMLGAGAALLPPIGRLPLFGYLAVGLVLAGGVAGMPWLARTLLRPLARLDPRLPPFELALRRLLGAPTQAAVALGGIVASTGLMIAMAVMVTSFRGSVDEWLDGFLSADLYVAAMARHDLFDPELQARLAAAPGVAAITFSKAVRLTLDPELPSVELIVRPVGGPGYTLPLIAEAERPSRGIKLWFSEPAARLYNVEPGDGVRLPIGTGAAGHVAGIWRDYVRQQGAIVIDAQDYEALTGDRARSEAALELEPGASTSAVRDAIRARLPEEIAAQVQIAEPATLRAMALTLFDRSFAITYVLEAIAILIGLAGVAATMSAQTIARTREFGMLRHIGMSPRQILAMLASEGALLGLIGIAAGTAVGLAISQILIHVINPQSFNWTMATRLPEGLLAGVAVALVLTSAGTALLAGRRAVSRDAVRAVSEDW
ncbi:MAG TPA: ABC transporter permease [Allosphingosinicella sp.]|nr:ABC transporter permease [Allosphingosinicella sp.]